MVSESSQEYFPVVDGEGRLIGVFSMEDVRRVVATPEVWSLLVADDLGVTGASVVFLDPDEDLHTALRKFMAAEVTVLPVLEGPPPSRLLGLLSHHQMMQAYDRVVHRLQEGAEGS